MMIRVQAVLKLAGMRKPDGRFDDEHIRTTCSMCKTEQTLGESMIESQGDETQYRCKNGCQHIVIVSPATPDAKPWPGRGYRMNDYVIRNISDLFIRIGDRDLVLEARPHSLDPENDQPQ